MISEGYPGKRPVIAGGEVIAYLTHRYEYNPSATYDAVHFRQTDPSGSSERVTRAYPENIFGVPSWDPDYIDQRQAEFDPTGGNVGTVNNYQPQYGTVNPDFLPIESESSLYIDGQRVPCELDGMTVPCSMVQRQAAAGASPAGFNVHSHFYFWMNGVGVSPRKVFCSGGSNL